MASLTVKNIPAPLLRALRKSAETNRRSLNQQVIHLLATALGSSPESTSAERERQIAQWRKLVGRWESSAADEEDLTATRTTGRKVDL